MKIEWNKKYRRQQRYYYAHKEEISKKRNEDSKEKNKEYQKQYFQKNKKRIKDYRKGCYRNTIMPKGCNNWGEWTEEKKKLGKELKAVRQARYVHRKRASEGTFTSDEWNELKKIHKHRCVICNKKEPFKSQYFKKLTIDHIISLSKGGTNYINNIQPACHKCNALKQAKLET